MEHPAIDVRGLVKRFGDLTAVDDISFTVQPGTITALLGGNGAGKTTTISMLLGLLLPTAGSITVLGVNLLRERFRVLPRMNFSSPYVDLPGRLTVRQNLRVYAMLYAVRDFGGRLSALSDELDLAPLIDRPCRDLSAGQKTRVALAKALLNEPALLLMDEPTASLDPDIAEDVRHLLRAYQARTGATILLASHNMTEVERICHDVIIMRQGHIVDQGSPTALLQRYARQSMEDVFLDIARQRQPGMPREVGS